MRDRTWDWPYIVVMANVQITELDDRLYDMYRAMADAAGISIEEQLRRVLTAHLSEERRAMVREVEEGLARMREKYGVMPDSTPGIREDRDARG